MIQERSITLSNHAHTAIHAKCVSALARRRRRAVVLSPTLLQEYVAVANGTPSNPRRARERTKTNDQPQGDKERLHTCIILIVVEDSRFSFCHAVRFWRQKEGRRIPSHKMIFLKRELQRNREEYAAHVYSFPSPRPWRQRPP